MSTSTDGVGPWPAAAERELGPTVGRTRVNNVSSGGSAILALSDQDENTSALQIGADGSSSNFTGTVTNSDTAPGGLTKLGAGTLTLSGPVSYTGRTRVIGGTLSVPQPFGPAAQRALSVQLLGRWVLVMRWRFRWGGRDVTGMSAKAIEKAFAEDWESERDRAGRRVAWVRRQDTRQDSSEFMVRRGLARYVASDKSDREMQDILRRAEKSARAARRGIWAAKTS